MVNAGINLRLLAGNGSDWASTHYNKFAFLKFIRLKTKKIL